MVHMYYTWYTCTTHGTHVLHMVHMYYTWYTCTTHGTHVLHMVHMYYTWYTCTTHGMPLTYSSLLVSPRDSNLDLCLYVLLHCS